MDRNEIGYINVNKKLLEILKSKFPNNTFYDASKGKKKLYNTIIFGEELPEEEMAFYVMFKVRVVCLYNSTLPNIIDLMKKAVREKKEFSEKELLYIDVVNKYQYLNDKIEALVDINNHHSKSVAYLVKLFSDRLHLEKDRELDMYIAALMHDIGKIYVNPEYLCKKGKLTEEEYENVKIHPQKAYELFKDILPENVLCMIRNHHIRENGGYPDTNDEISEWSKIIGLSDSYDAMTSKRVYNKPMSKEEGINEILLCSKDKSDGGKGVMFNPYLAELFVKTIA